MNKNRFSPQREPHTAKLCLSVVFKLLWGNSLRTFLLDIKVCIAETSTEKLRNLFFLPCLNGQILWKIWIGLNNCFDQTSKRG